MSASIYLTENLKEFIANMSEEVYGFEPEDYDGTCNPFYGQKHTEETRRKISEVQKGRPKSEETKRKMSKAQKGISVVSRRSIGFKGRTHSEETKRKMSESLKRKSK